MKKTPSLPAPQAFKSAAAFRQWLRKHHATEQGLLVRCFKTAARDQGLTYREALDEALCMGWIDGVRRRVDEISFSVRFSPRRPKSRWSAVNVRRVRELQDAGRMRPPGQAAFEARVASEYSYETRPRTLAPELLKHFRARARAWQFYAQRPPWYRRTTSFWVMSAKKEETRARRLALLIECCARGSVLPGLER
jgi:uncharacterized protein YdeI (YjbR/CyaY-like superfamily)